MIQRDDASSRKSAGVAKAACRSIELEAAAEPSPTESAQFEQTLRPQSLGDYIGQPEIKRTLEISLAAAKKRSEPLEHILLHGPAGLGKTTLAFIIAHETGTSVKITSGPALERQGDLAALLTNLAPGDVFFIDEIHRLRPAVEEVLYSAMEDYCLDIMIGKGPSARSVRVNLPRFTLIGATTKMSMLSSPLRDRFGNVFKFSFYDIEDIKTIVLRSAKILNTVVEVQAALKLANCSRQTPRIANRLLRRVRDFAEFHGKSVITETIVEDALASLGVDALGLDDMDRSILRTMIEKFNGGPVGLTTIAAALSEEQATIEDIYEPYLIQLGFMERTPRGRLVTDRGFTHLGLESSSNQRVLI